ncbi:hypothetical protein [Enterococcus casseliflavus]|uniref:hypothetical protein n=1 Tax=Enterococcus casseliflavus TaxID=37734 RepID=UPI0034D37F2B
MPSREQQTAARNRVKRILTILNEKSYEQWLHEQHRKFIEENDELIDLALDSMKKGEYNT